MPGSMLRSAYLAAYGNEEAENALSFDKQEELLHERHAQIQKKKEFHNQQKEAEKFHLGDSVMVYPDKKNRHCL